MQEREASKVYIYIGNLSKQKVMVLTVVNCIDEVLQKKWLNIGTLLWSRATSSRKLHSMAVISVVTCKPQDYRRILS